MARAAPHAVFRSCTRVAMPCGGARLVVFSVGLGGSVVFKSRRDRGRTEARVAHSSAHAPDATPQSSPVHTGPADGRGTIARQHTSHESRRHRDRPAMYSHTLETGETVRDSMFESWTGPATGARGRPPVRPRRGTRRDGETSCADERDSARPRTDGRRQTRHRGHRTHMSQDTPNIHN